MAHRTLASVAQTWFRLFLYGILILIVYNDALKQLVFADWGKEDYSYCYIIPFLIAYLVWERREPLRRAAAGPEALGLVPVGLGLALFWIGELGGEYFTLYVSFWLVVVGLILIHWGWEKVKPIAFILVMALTMFPLPNIFNFPLSLRLKLISSQIGVWMLHLYGLPAYREGNVIDLGFTQLQVVDACSGLRYVLPLAVLSLVLAYWFKDHIWKRVVLFLSSVPIAITVNSSRIAVTGILYGIWGPSVAEGFFHGFSAWLLFLLTIPILLLEMFILKRLPPRNRPMDDRAARSDDRPAVSGTRTMDDVKIDGRGGGGSVTSARLLTVIVVALLGLTALLSHFVQFREIVPIKKPLASFPLDIGQWQGKREAMEAQFIEGLKFSDYVIVDYHNVEGKGVNFYTAYYESQRKGESVHSPETCLPGGGWELREAGTVRVRLADGREMVIKRGFIEKQGARQLTYYWFQERGRILTNMYELKLYGFWDALTRRRTDGALVRLITPVYGTEELAVAEKRLQDFVVLAAPVLKQYIPD